MGGGGVDGWGIFLPISLALPHFIMQSLRLRLLQGAAGHMCRTETTTPTSAIFKVDKVCVLIFLNSASAHLMLV